MKKLLYLFIAFALLAGKCKKDKTDDGAQEQTFECLVHKVDYVAQNPQSGDVKEDHVTYKYKQGTNLIKQKTRLLVFATDSTDESYNLTYNYYYADENKGLLERIDLLFNQTVYAKFIYTIQNDKYAERRVEWINNSGNGYDVIHKYTYTYDNNGKLIQERYQYFDVDHNGAGDIDETTVYTYTGDNATSAKVYDTNDMNTLKEEYNYQYDQGKRAFDNVLTQTYPKTRVNNIIHMEHNVYGTSPSTEIINTAITYNNKGFPTKYEETDDRGNPVSTEEVEYDNCN